jgi:saccharopepsin
MIFSPLVLALLPFASAAVHKLKLHKLPPVAPNAQLETAYLAEKYGVQRQLPLMGSGGAGRRVQLENSEDLYWSQGGIQGGHGVPLTSLSLFYCGPHAS